MSLVGSHEKLLEKKQTESTSRRSDSATTIGTPVQVMFADDLGGKELGRGSLNSMSGRIEMRKIDVFELKGVGYPQSITSSPERTISSKK